MSPPDAFLQSVRDPTASDPLSDVSRAERKALLVSTFVAIAISKGGLIPKEIPSLKITLEATQELTLLFLVAAGLCYYLFGFWIYGLSDLKRRRAILAADEAEAGDVAGKFLEEFKASRSESLSTMDPALVSQLGQMSRFATVASDVRKFSPVRILYDFYLPLVLGSVALGLVLDETWLYPEARPWTLAVTIFALVMLGVLTWRHSKMLVHLFRRSRHQLRRAHFGMLLKRLQALPEGSHERARLQARVMHLLEDKLIKGPWT